MGDDRELSSRHSHKTTATEVVNYYFPIYLSYGMTASEYWDGESFLAPAYKKAYEMSLVKENRQAWLFGAYVREAVISAISGAKYPEDAYKLSFEDQEQTDDSDNGKEEIMKQQAESFDRYVNAFNNNK